MLTIASTISIRESCECSKSSWLTDTIIDVHGICFSCAADSTLEGPSDSADDDPPSDRPNVRSRPGWRIPHTQCGPWSELVDWMSERPIKEGRYI